MKALLILILSLFFVVSAYGQVDKQSILKKFKKID